MESKRVCERGSEIVAEECAGDCHSCYLLGTPDECQYCHAVLSVVVVMLSSESFLVESVRGGNDVVVSVSSSARYGDIGRRKCR